MKISYNWLKNYLELDPVTHSPEVLADALPLLGFDVETIERVGPPQLENVVVGKVLNFKQHPNADRLRCCEVSTGNEGEIHQIVCGAKNFQAGDCVMVALPGAVLPGDFKIKKSKLRGEPSEGMLCSAKELKVGADHDGILVLDSEIPLGTPLNSVFADDDTVLSLEITPNRVDVLSHLGVSREIAARFGLNLKYPEVKASVSNAGESNTLLTSVKISATEICPQYTAFCIKGVNVAESPKWLKSALEAIGLRPINNVVDITNFVLYETGQPLHAFDAAKISGKRLEVRNAKEGELITTLDGVERKLSPKMAVIADDDRPLVIAGVMGSVTAEVDESTTDVVLETAYFNPGSIRATSRTLGVSSDSSYRFERGIDPKGLLYASLRALDLIKEIAGGEIIGDRLADGSEFSIENSITFYPAQAVRFMGFEIENPKMIEIFEALDFEVSEQTDPNGELHWEVTVPSYRGDLTRDVDLIEELVRLYGTDQIPETPVKARGIATSDHRAYTVTSKISQYLNGQNFNEAYLYSLRDPEETKELFGADEHQLLALDNPLQSDQSHLRASLIPGLLDTLKLNTARGTGAKRFFESGHIFRADGNKVTELFAFSFVIVGETVGRSWKERASSDFYTARTVCENILEIAKLGSAKIPFEPMEENPLWQVEQSAVNGCLERMGYRCEVGMLNIVTLKDKWDLDVPVFAGSIEVDPKCFQRATKRGRHKFISNQPNSVKDLALIVDADVLFSQVRSEITKFAKKAVKGFECEAIECFDVYSGEGLPEGKKSFAVSFSFRAADRTLKDKEINATFDSIQSSIEQSTQYQIRK